MKCPVSVYTEWGPLKEVIVGDCLNFNCNLLDPTFQLVYYEKLATKSFRETEQYRVDKKRFKERVEDLNNLQKVLEELGVTVRRPKPLEKAIPFKTPWFKAICTAPDSVRDIAMCLGDKIIETPPTIRGRYFETHLLHDIFYDYFRQGAKWITSPRPTLDLNRIDVKGEKYWKSIDHYHDMDQMKDFEINFDAANLLKFGRDIIFNVGSKNHELGAYWLESILGDEFRVHRVRVCDSHIDAVIAPIAPGKMLYNPVGDHKKTLLKQLPDPLKKWDIYPMQEENLDFCLDEGELELATVEGMFINILSVNEKQIVIQDNAYNNIKMLEKLGFEPIPVRFNQGRLFSGGLHCCTIDVRRDEEKEDYFK
jgi:glycine amidinotransferase